MLYASQCPGNLDDDTANSPVPDQQVCAITNVEGFGASSS